MAMRGWGERPHLATSVWVMRGRPGLRATSGRPGLAFDHDRHRGIDDPRTSERVEAEDGGGGQAAAGRESIRGADFVPVQLWQGIDEVAKQARLGVFPPVPRRVLALVTEPEVRGKVDDGRGERLELVDLATGLAVGEGEEEHVDRLQ